MVARAASRSRLGKAALRGGVAAAKTGVRGVKKGLKYALGGSVADVGMTAAEMAVKGGGKVASAANDASDELADVLKTQREKRKAKKEAEKEAREKAGTAPENQQDNYGVSNNVSEALHTAYFNFATSLVNEDAFERGANRARALDGNEEARQALEADAERVAQELRDREDALKDKKPKKKGSNFVNSQKMQMRHFRNTIPRRVVRGAGSVVKKSFTSPYQALKAKGRKGKYTFDHTEYQRIGSIIAEKSAAWTRKEGKNPSGGLNAKGVASYRAKNPGSKLKTAVTTKPSKLKKGSKAAKRRRSFCARMSGMRKRQKASNNTGKDRLSLSLKKWNC
jgi:hypothetical protein